MVCLRAAQVYTGERVANKNEIRVRVALPKPFLGYLKSMAEQQPALPLKIHLIDRGIEPRASELGGPVWRVAACGVRGKIENITEYVAPLPANLARRASACMNCCAVFPSYFDLIPRCLS